MSRLPAEDQQRIAGHASGERAPLHIYLPIEISPAGISKRPLRLHFLDPRATTPHLHIATDFQLHSPDISPYTRDTIPDGSSFNGGAILQSYNIIMQDTQAFMRPRPLFADLPFPPMNRGTDCQKLYESTGPCQSTGSMRPCCIPPEPTGLRYCSNLIECLCTVGASQIPIPFQYPPVSKSGRHGLAMARSHYRKEDNTRQCDAICAPRCASSCLCMHRT